MRARPIGKQAKPSFLHTDLFGAQECGLQGYDPTLGGYDPTRGGSQGGSQG